MGAEEGEVGVEVVDYLSEDAGPAYTVYSRDGMRAVDLRVAKEGFDYVLTIVEGSFDADIVRVGIEDGGHLSFLNRRHFAFWMEHED